MKFYFGDLTNLFANDVDTSWNRLIFNEKLKTDFLNKSGITGIVSGLILLFYYILFVFTNDINYNAPFSNILLILFIYFIFGIPLIITHELIHLVCMPNFYNNPNIIIGLHEFHPYVTILEPIELKRYVFVLLMPTFTLTIIPLIFCILHESPSPWIIIPSVSNLFLSGIDIYSAYFYLKNIPLNSLLIGTKFGMYYKSINNY